MENYELITMKDGLPVLSEKVESLLENYNETKKEFEKKEEEFRTALLKAMQENDIVSCQVGKYKIQQVISKPKIVLNEEKFLDEVDINLANSFAKLETSFTFEEEKFAKEHSDLYQKYLTKHEKINWDLDKMKELLPNLYISYVEEIPSDKKPYLKITESKKK